ncbi:MAG TPA: cysteine desulfurase family protein [Edaphocola sp.]|nr:cysteine desulfurase family protein [Edaphocola sp.]
MNRIYFDNAATTMLDKEVLEVMLPYLTEKFGNPSSIYSYGRESRLGIELARKSIAKLLGVKPGNIYFTSGGTESTNTAIAAAVKDLGVKRIITSPIEHHATLHTVDFFQNEGIEVDKVSILPNGHVDLESLKTLLKNNNKMTLVSLMHANNEIGNLLPIHEVGEICEEYGAYFHCDTVQTLGHYPLNLSEIKVHFANGAAHKFHGPKGVGILYIADNVHIHPYLKGGGQERNLRAGTENLYGIVGLAKALELTMKHLSEEENHIRSLKNYMAAQLKSTFPEIIFNGDWNGNSLYTVLNVSFPQTPKTEMLLMNLDMQGICASGGSACSSGANVGSHVIEHLPHNKEVTPIRFSFCKFNTKEEVDRVVNAIKNILHS